MVIMITTGIWGRGRGGEEENMVNIHLYGYNIRNAMYRGINSALRVIVQANMDLGVLFKTKIMNGVYMRRSSDCNVIVSEAPIKHQGGG